MKQLNLKVISIVILITSLLVTTPDASAQVGNANSFDETKKEIESIFGFFPVMFKVFPAYALPGAWEAFKEIGSSEAKIPAKYRELIQLSVAAQIPCIYCIHFHTGAAKVFGATEDEIHEAIAFGASTRHWSMILQGNDVDYEVFKKEVKEMLKVLSGESQTNK